VLPKPHNFVDARLNPNREGVKPRQYVAVRGVIPMRKADAQDAEQINELCYGDVFSVYESKDGFMWGQVARDQYVGYVDEKHVSDSLHKPTHRIKNLTSFIFAEPSIKSPPIDRLTFFSAVEITKEDARFCELKTGGFVHAHHIVKINEWNAPDGVTTATRLLNVPYLWGGVTPLGIDCSGLIQLALNAAGMDCPRDSDMQAASLGDKIADTETGTAFQRGDIVFFPGHVGFMADAVNLLHANAYHGCVVTEPLADVIARGSKVTAVRRLKA
jgi:cell wall-associated NlpC family hydrolase